MIQISVLTLRGAGLGSRLVCQGRGACCSDSRKHSWWPTAAGCEREFAEPPGSSHPAAWRPCGISRDGHAAQDPAPGAVRDHAGDPRRCTEVQKRIAQAGLEADDFVFPSRIHDSPHQGTRQHARILEGWVEKLGLDPADYGTHSMRRTKATPIYRRTSNLRDVQLLPGHRKLESTVRYLGTKVDDALEISEQTEI